MSHDHNVHIEETQDAEMLMTLNHEVQQCHVEMFPHIFKPPVAEEILDFFRKMVADNTFKHLMACVDQEPAGFIQMEFQTRRENPFKYATCCLYVHQMCVLSKYRRTGVGRELLQVAEQYARNAGIYRLELDYWTENTVAKTFYNHLGYRIFHEQVKKDILKE